MNVKLAETAGFCFGVKRAVKTVEDEIEKNDGRRIFTYGPIIHNSDVIKDFESRGVYAVDSFGTLDTHLQENSVSVPDDAANGQKRSAESEDENKKKPSATLIIRAHGVPEKVIKEAENIGFEVIDATCPFVKKIHNIVNRKSGEGDIIVVAGDADHPEVKGITGWTKGPYYVVKNAEEAEKLPFFENKRVTVVFQTTFDTTIYKDFVEIVNKKGYYINIINTICNATADRQNEAVLISKSVDVMLVIGDKSSANTRRLYEICKECCMDTYYIQNTDDLKSINLQSGITVGITAGASTPQNIIQEVFSKMSEEKSFDQLIDESMKTIRTGEIVDGTVIAVKPDELVLNIGYKSDGIVSKEEYSNDSHVDLEQAVSVGDTMEVKVLKVNDGDGQVQLSYKRIGEEKANKRLEEAFENEEELTVKVEQVTNGGLIAGFEGGKIFIPASLVSDVFEKDLSKYQDQEIEIVITEFNPRKRRIIGNRKKLLIASREERAKELLETLQVGDVVEGTVKSVTNFGAFVDLGGVDGLLHISEMSWGRVFSPKQVVKVGDVIRVYIKDMTDGKIALSAKFPEENPWILAKEKYVPGTIVSGKVARMADFGAFIELEPGIDALLHVSQISRKHVKKPSDILKTGQVIDVKIVDFKEDEKKISLSRRDFEDDLMPDNFYAEKEAAEKAAAEAKAAEKAAAAEAGEEQADVETPVEEAAVAAEEAAREAETVVEEAAEAEQKAEIAEEVIDSVPAAEETPAEAEKAAE